MFNDLTNYEDDPIEALFKRISLDDSSNKIDLGIGVFRDQTGQVPVMQAVVEAEKQLLKQHASKSYMSPLGNMDYCADIERSVLGEGHDALGRMVSAQTPGAGAALRGAAEFVESLCPTATVWFGEPCWGHQIEFFERAGLTTKQYRYYNREQGELDFNGMLEDLEALQENDVLLLHGCCHNPTGEDPDLAQWQTIADLINEKRVLPLVDIAYQGFGSGIEEDVAGVRLLAAQVSELILTVSSSKSFGIYRERAGLLSIIHQKQASGDSLKRKLRDTLRQLYFMAPNHGAAVVHEILSSQTLEQLWRDELNAVRHQVVAMRVALKATLEQANPEFDASFIPRQKGMFSCLPLSEAQQLRMEQQYHIYMLPNARVNVAAMSVEQSQALASAFAGILSE
ncbi:MAG: aromatic amino acid transaminase [Gammaproteobacteria bacterium]|jgi:aspartate aminotransferase|nr:aromatic amino acid transaminase [Gammaproteobacteria bacterium]MBT6243924.1 aromatic amino acid transaminase [Gammaproteobacteria bacterium]